VTGLRMGVEHELKISGVIHKLNRVINRSRLSTRFISLIYGELERNGTFVYVNAGHPPPFLIKENSVEPLATGGTILGPIKDTIFKRGFAFINPGDVMVFFTDGIIEREDADGEMFGEERLVEFVEKNRKKEAREIVNRLFKHLGEFGKKEKWGDDATLIVLKRLD
ncbi:MAG: serine/threonine-protein phosphatase, partial [Candidatus Krumholzibacteria bacterium]|nr:serine/threonine-protein phosphatase [Candidatus Krumholzibacteria bacterium]